MTAAENLEMGGFVYRSHRADLRRRINHVLELFPVLRERRGSGPARSRAESSRCSPWRS